MRPSHRLSSILTHIHPTMSPYAIVAGVGSGTGASVARKFAAAYPVACLSRTPANYEPLVKEINAAGGKAIGVSADVSNADSMKEAVQKIESELGNEGCAAAVLNAAGGFVMKPFLELSEEDFMSCFLTSGCVFIPVCDMQSCGSASYHSFESCVWERDGSCAASLYAAHGRS